LKFGDIYGFRYTSLNGGCVSFITKTGFVVAPSAKDIVFYSGADAILSATDDLYLLSAKDMTITSNKDINFSAVDEINIGINPSNYINIDSTVLGGTKTYLTIRSSDLCDIFTGNISMAYGQLSINKSFGSWESKNIHTGKDSIITVSSATGISLESSQNIISETIKDNIVIGLGSFPKAVYIDANGHLGVLS